MPLVELLGGAMGVNQQVFERYVNGDETALMGDAGSEADKISGAS